MAILVLRVMRAPSVVPTLRLVPMELSILKLDLIHLKDVYLAPQAITAMGLA